MLVRLDPTLLHVPARQELFEFLRHPFTEQSCQRVEQALPIVAPAYRALAATQPLWEASCLTSLTANPTVAFMPVAGMGVADLPLLPLELLQAQVELLQEDLRDHQERLSTRNGRAMVNGATPAHAALALQAFSLHEATFLTFAGFFQVRRNDSLVEFSLTPLGRECLGDRMRSTAMQNFTDGAIRATLQASIHHARSQNQLSPRQIADAVMPWQLDALEDKLLDAYFSLSSRMQSDPAVAPLIARARRLCRWMALLEMVRLAGEHALQPDNALLSRLQLDPRLLDAVITERARALSSDKGIHRTPSGGFTLAEASLAHAISCCKGAVLSSVETQPLGEFFEAHAISYVEECVPAEDYVVRKGIEPSGKDKGCSYDCDLILFEPKRRKIFFVQTKWKRDCRTANLDDELSEWRAKNSALTHGVSQLQALRARLSERTVLDQVKGRLNGFRLTDQQILEHSHFIVVHTLPYFNAYQHEGVVIYEWNYFRNLLLRGAIQRAQAPLGKWGEWRELPTTSCKETLPLEDPEPAIDHFYQAIGLDLKSVPQLLDARMQARYGFDVQLHGRTRWSWLLGRKMLRVVRPYL